MNKLTIQNDKNNIRKRNKYLSITIEHMYAKE